MIHRASWLAKLDMLAIPSLKRQGGRKSDAPTSTLGLHMYAHKGACSSTHVCTCTCAKTCIHKCKIHTQEKWKKKTSKALYLEA